ncbi:MAG TPA: hypothetical protein VN081_04520 [Dongiaceae bacterium]|nr:hypothetical protein [Dongiaceae bacterium]
MYKDYESPLATTSQNWVSVMLSDFVGTLVDYTKHDLRHGSKGSLLVPIRVKSPVSVNAGYSVGVFKDHVHIYAANIPAQGFPDAYDVSIPRVKHDPRHWQLKKMAYSDTFRTFLRKVYTKSFSDDALRFTMEQGPNPVTVQVNVMSFINTIVDYLIEEQEFTIYFLRDRWTVTRNQGTAVLDVKKWFTNGTAAMLGNGSRGLGKRKPRARIPSSELESAP